MTSIVDALTATTTEFNQAIAEQEGSDLDKEAFLLLLVTQFQYQDPLDPMDDTEFIAQLAQFSNLEQLMTLNESMTTLTEIAESQEMINATSYIGKTVDATGNSVSKVTDSTTGDITISSVLYAIGEASVSGQMNIYDSDSNLVNSYSIVSQAAGTHSFDWDGMNYLGNEAPDGVYTMIPVFYNAEGTTITGYDMVVDGRVTGVLVDSGITYLALDDGRVTALSDVRRVSEVTVISSTDTEDTDTEDTDTEDTDTDDTTDDSDITTDTDTDSDSDSETAEAA